MIYWFEATSDVGYIFNVHIIGYDKTITDAVADCTPDPVTARNSPAVS